MAVSFPMSVLVVVGFGGAGIRPCPILLWASDLAAGVAPPPPASRPIEAGINNMSCYQTSCPPVAKCCGGWSGMRLGRCHGDQPRPSGKAMGKSGWFLQRHLGDGTADVIRCDVPLTCAVVTSPSGQGACRLETHRLHRFARSKLGRVFRFVRLARPPLALHLVPLVARC